MTAPLRLLRLGRVPRRAWASLLVAASACAGAACTYDFTVGRNAPRDGGANGDGGTAADDAGSSNDGGSDVGADGNASNAAQCADLDAKISSSRQAAIQCDTSLGDFCDQFVLDECGCAIGVVDTTDPDTRTFTDAVTSFKAAGCTPVCPQQSCSRSTSPGQYFCQHGPGTTVGACTRTF